MVGQPAHDSGNNLESLIGQRLGSIDVLRGLAVLAVIFVHIPHEAPGGWRQNLWFFPSLLMEFGYLGVPLFVLISGFCIHRRAAIAKSQTGRWQLSWVRFWKRRFWRLYPPYVAAIAFSLLLNFTVHHRHPQLLSGLSWDLATHGLMIHNLTDRYAGGLGNAAFWSLGMEEQLYALYGLLLVGFRRHWPVIAIVAALTIGWRLLLPVFGESSLGRPPLELGSWYLWPVSFWLHWTLGAVAVDAHFGNRLLPRWTQSLAAAIGCLSAGMILNRVTFQFLESTSWFDFDAASGVATILPWAHYLGELIIAVGFCCLLRWGLTKEQWLSSNAVARVVRHIGKASYSIYLVHVPAIYTLDHFTSIGGDGTDWLLRCGLYLAVSLATGVVFYFAVERWFLTGQRPSFRVRSLPPIVVCSHD